MKTAIKNRIIIEGFQFHKLSARMKNNIRPALIHIYDDHFIYFYSAHLEMQLKNTGIEYKITYK